MQYPVIMARWYILKVTHTNLCFQVPWKSLGKEPVIVLIDRVFVLAYPAPDGRTVKVYCWIFFLFVCALSRL